MMIPVPKMEPCVVLRGPDPGSKFMDKPTNPPTTGPFDSDLVAQTKVSLEVVWGGAGTRFPHLEGEIDEWSSVKTHKKLIQLCAHRLHKNKQNTT